MSSDNAPEEPGSSGTQLGSEEKTLSVSTMSTDSTSNVSTNETALSSKGEEETLESHEVIELQMFIERKAWIENKIRLLEKMPPIEVFVGLDAIKSSAEEVPGLPTRAELQAWMVEQDIIEKETEIFDKGELKKLRNFTRAATQRNLSPEDTDLIELTLTTIYELDKLLHLLRDRSENLDLLGIRLTWEEHRTGSWVDRRKIIADLQAFLETRARFSPSVYETIPKVDSPEAKRRGSIASIASVASTSSDSSFSSPGFSRSTRFKLAELLSRDAATLAGRVTSLKLGGPSAAGKVLDKLIDHSRKPVPDELLDEQDILEEKCINEMENVGKFAMNVVMQWRKADEVYIETMKDNSAAQTLLEEIEIATLQHPSGRLSSTFTSRADAIIRRLQLRGNPSAPNTSFPHPIHPLFPDQQPFNDTLAQSLSSDISAATLITRSAEAAAKEYRIKYEAVKHVETLKESIAEVTGTLNSLIDRFQNGVAGGEGDGTPPSLTSTDCLRPTEHSVFVALLPSMLEEHTKADKVANDLVRAMPIALAHLNLPGIDAEFRAHASAELQNLVALCTEAQHIRDEVTRRVARLKEARRIWSAMDITLKDLELIRREVVDIMDNVRWQQESTNNAHGAPPTPESPRPLPLPLQSVDEKPGTQFVTQMSELERRAAEAVFSPLEVLSPVLEIPLKDSLQKTSDGLKAHFHRVNQAIKLLQSIRDQASTMASVRDESNDLQLQIESLIVRYEETIQRVLNNNIEDVGVANSVEDLQREVDTTKASSSSFSDSLARRVPLISQRNQRSSFVKRSHSNLELTANFHASEYPIELPFEIQSVDDAVRADCNAYSMRVNGRVRKLDQTMANYQLARMAKEADTARSSFLKELEAAEEGLTTLKSSFESISANQGISQPLQDLLPEIDSYVQTYRTKLQQSLTGFREKCRQMENSSRSNRSSFQESLLLSRANALSDSDTQLTAWESGCKTLRSQVMEAYQAEVERLKRQQQEEEKRRLEEEQRLAAEEAERARLKREKEEEEARLRLEKERRQEELRLQALEAERAEQERQDREAAEKAKEEEARLAEERRSEAERERHALEEAERARLEQERRDMEMKLNAAVGQLAEERRMFAEKERLAAEEAERVAKERERSEKEKINGRTYIISQDDDVFGLHVSSSDMVHTITDEMKDLLAQIARLRKRLRSIGIKELIRPSTGPSSLPTSDQAKKIQESFRRLEQDVKSLPESVEVASVNLQLKSCRAEVQTSSEMLSRLGQLASLSDAIATCDTALSDLLEHIDSYPSIPLGPLSSSYTYPPDSSPESQLSGRLQYTNSLIDAMSSAFEPVADDHRARDEQERVLQTWSELEDMGKDRVSGRKSRPSSVASTSHNSSGRDSRSSSINPRASNVVRKSNGYTTLSAAASRPNIPRGRLNIPPAASARRAVSGSEESASRSSSRMSVRSTQRSTSGSSLYGTTFASRQRTTSLTPSTATPPPMSHSRSRTSTSSSIGKRSESPALSDASSLPRSHNGRSSTSMSTWSRAPRVSFPTIPRATPKKVSAPRKEYVANPKSKLDVAVGQVVNNLPVDINIEGVAGSWKDQSGKYWIGEKDPKLCFCRILRSQTVMVRVGGGWQELSKFIRTHFADSFRLMSETTLPLPSHEEKWISSSSLLEAIAMSPPRPPRTPEPRGSPSHVPSFSLSTPSGTSPRSILSTPSTKGSPLTPLQFMRRAEPEVSMLSMRPETPSKPPTGRGRTSTGPPPTPGRQNVWRP